MYIHTCTYLGVEDIGVYGLVVVVLVSSLVQVGEGIFEDLIYSGLPSARGTHTHQSVTHQLGLIELNDLPYLHKEYQGEKS